ncbi:MAG: polysaccharide biosynthesis protein [Dissulfurispiraceae bacterium]
MTNIIKEKSNALLQPSARKRRAFFLLSDFIIIVISLYCAFLIRFEFNIPDQYMKIFLRALPIFVVLKLFFFGLFGLYRITWRYVDISELNKIYASTAISESLLMVLILIPFAPHLSSLPLPYIIGFPRSVFFIDALIGAMLLSGLRISKRLFLEKVLRKGRKKEGERTIIVGAGSTAEMILRDIEQRGFSDFYPIGMLDDDKTKVGGYIRSVKVLGTIEILKEAIAKYQAVAVIIAIPSLNHKTLREIYHSAMDCGLKKIKIVPRIYDFHNPDINLKNLEEISIEDLIGRQTVEVDLEGIGNFVRDKSVLITGAGGSIGSEIVMQVCSFDPSGVILFDIDETELHNMSLRIGRTLPHLMDRCYFATGDVRDESRLDEIFSAHKPEIVFHAAAYKHVPMMESNPKESIKVNILGTYAIAKASARYGVSKFILISTDKAIRPTSIMGATKRIAEAICKAFNNNYKQTEYISVRFGNVLGSRGSVLPIFLEQLRHGGPLTVTHPDICRYFMTIPEAVLLVLQASVLGKGGEVLVLDMGEPVKIVTLAEELIRLHGLTPYVDIDIAFSGLRPGEKLFEEVLTAEEDTLSSKHKKVFVARTSETYSLHEMESFLEELKVVLQTAHMDDVDLIKKALGKYVRFYSENVPDGKIPNSAL